MRIESDIKLDFDDVLLRPKRSTLESRKEVSLVRAFKFKHSGYSWSGIPIISSNMTSVTTERVIVEMLTFGMMACAPKHLISKNSSNPNYILSAGFNSLPLAPESPFICLDVPNGYIEKFVKRVEEVRRNFPSLTIMAGNVVTPEMTEALILAGADVVKVGLGSGAACSTRLKTGIGYPQLSAVIECADAAHGLGGQIISDGGCVYPSDVVKAFAAGADFVMLGSMLAGHEENGVHFYGMASKYAVDEHAGGLKDYRAIEGREFTLPNKGPIAHTLQEITGGLKSACSYCGAKTLKDLPKCSTFLRVNHQANHSLRKYENE